MLMTVPLNVALVSMAVLIHYEALNMLSRLFRQMSLRHRFRLVLGVGGALCAHALEIWVFALAYWLLAGAGEFGALQGHFDGSLQDCAYYSFTTYTSLGFGDIHPVGLIRFSSALETLTGLVLIGWTASFIYVEMRRFWE